jgi:hypothetical protein
MLLLVVLLSQLASPSGEAPVVPPQELQKLWEDINLACRRLPYESDEGKAACDRRDAVTVQLSRLGWCFRYLGSEIKWEMCPRR